MTWPTYLLGAAYERRVNAWDGLALFRVLLVGELRKGQRRKAKDERRKMN